MQERAGCPSMSNVHAPQTPCSQRRCVAVRLSRSRSKSARCVRGSTSFVDHAPVDCKLDGIQAARVPDCKRARAPRSAAAALRPVIPSRTARAHRRVVDAVLSRRRPLPSTIGRPFVAPITARNDPSLRIVQHGTHRRCELAGLAADLEIAEPSARGEPGHLDRFQHLAGRERGLIGAGHEMHGGSAALPTPAIEHSAPSTQSTVTQSAAGSAWHRLPPTVPRLRTAR